MPNLVTINNILANKININNKYSVLIGSLVSALTPDGGRFAQIWKNILSNTFCSLCITICVRCSWFHKVSLISHLSPLNGPLKHVLELDQGKEARQGGVRVHAPWGNPYLRYVAERPTWCSLHGPLHELQHPQMLFGSSWRGGKEGLRGQERAEREGSRGGLHRGARRDRLLQMGLVVTC